MSNSSKSMLFRSISALVILLAAFLGYWMTSYDLGAQFGIAIAGGPVSLDPDMVAALAIALWLVAFGYTCLAHRWWKLNRSLLREALGKKELGQIALKVEPWLYYTRWPIAWLAIVIAGNIGGAAITGGIFRLLFLYVVFAPIDWLIKTAYANPVSETISATSH